MTVVRSGAPTSSLERDARRTNEAHAGEVRPGDIAIGVIIGRTSEFFDFFVYAIASVRGVSRSWSFPTSDALTGTLYSFAIFALAFVARPFGTVIFTAIDRAYGRGMKLTVALFLLGTSTVAIAFLPGYEEIGIASAYLLALFRIGQGLALGGSWDGLASLLALNAPPEPSRLVRDDSAARRAARLDGRERAVRLLHRQSVRRGLPRLGLALSVLRRVRDQRGRAVRAPAYRRHARIHQAVRDARAAAGAHPGNVATRRPQHRRSARSRRSRASRCSTW